MVDELLTEILAAHADHLNADGDGAEDYLALFPAHRETLAPLLYLAERLKHVLAPVEPAPAFERQLRATLVSAARDVLLARSRWRGRLVFRPWWPEQWWDLPELIRLPAPPNRQVLVRAAAGGAGLAAAGVAAYVIHDRFFSQDPTPPA